MGVDVSIPKDFINETSQRLRTYKRISSANSDGDLQKIYAEINDRYGKMPPSVNNLFEYAKLRKSAESLRIISVDKTPNGFAVKLSEGAKISPEKLMECLSKHETANFSPNGILRVEVKIENLIEAALLTLEEIRAD